MMLALTMLVVVSAQEGKPQQGEPKIVIAVLNYDFGRFPKTQVKAVVVRVWNKGTAPLLLEDVSASCGCTSVKWTKKPIQPGCVGYIRVTFDGQYLSDGKFHKEVNITSNTASRYHRFWVNGEVY